MRLAVRRVWGTLTAALAFAGCQAQSPGVVLAKESRPTDATTVQSDGAVKSPPAGVRDAAPEATVWRTVGPMRVQLETDGSACVLVVDRQKGEAPQKVKMDLRSPCYFVVWGEAFVPRSKAGRSSLGGPSDVMVWRQRQAGTETLALAVIGDEIPETLKGSDRMSVARQRGFHCAGSAQGVVIRGSSLSKITKRDQVGIFCIEVPIDEASFWLTTHPR